MPDRVDRRQLAQALVTGPFSAALRLAVRSSGLSLERVQARLLERDVRLSKTALSNWQSGRTQPERAASREALTALESVLGVPSGALARLVGPPRPRGRWVRRRPGDLSTDQAWARPDGLSRALARMGATPETIHKFDRVAIHSTAEVGADRGLRWMRYHLVLRATADGVDRYTAAYRSDLVPLSAIEDTCGCRVGRKRHDDETGFTTYELLLDHPLAAGDLAVVEYRLAFDEYRPESYHAQRVSSGTTTLSLGVRFAEPPVRVHYRHLSSVADAEAGERELRVGISHTARLVVADPEPGIYRLGWDWE